MQQSFITPRTMCSTARNERPTKRRIQALPSMYMERQNSPVSRRSSAAGVPHLIFRTAWVYSTRGRNFLRTILRLATEKEELRVVRDQFGAPTWSRAIAEATVKILAQLTSQDGSAANSLLRVSGIYHLTAAGETTWYDFARAILEEAVHLSPAVEWFEEATRGRPLITRRIIPITTAEYPTPAARPAFSVLSNSHLIRTFGVELPHWREQLHLMFEQERAQSFGFSPGVKRVTD